MTNNKDYHLVVDPVSGNYLLILFRTVPKSIPQERFVPYLGQLHSLQLILFSLILC
jgi:hypothetical protein